MKQLLLFSFSFILLIGAISCSNSDKIWLVSMNETKESVKQILNKEKIKFVDQDTTFNIDASIKYLDIDWDGATISFNKDVTTAVSFRKHTGDALTKDQKKTVVYHFDDIYGEHEHEKSAEYGASSWSWEKGDIKATFVSMFKGQWAILIVLKKKETKSDKQ